MEEGAGARLVQCAEGDLRRAITFLQSAARLAGAGKKVTGVDGVADEMDLDTPESDGAMVTVRTIEEIAGVIPDDQMQRLITAMTPRTKGIVYENVDKVVTDLVTDGWSAGQLVTQVCPVSVHSIGY